MSAAKRPSSLAGLIRMRLAGVAFLAVIAGLIGLTIALYNKAFTPVVKVTLQADRIGNQLSPPADVKLRGLLVGEVRRVSSTGNGATIELALQPDKVDLIPANVEARLLPKTLFGEKFVSLVVPEQPAGEPIGAGDVIPQDRSETARETEEVLDNFLPLLQSLKPAELSRTLNALSSTLRGRGDRLGKNFVMVDEYFRELNPSVPGIQENFRGLADVSENYADAAPDFLEVLDNLSVVNTNLVEQREELDRFLASTTSSTREFDRFLRENERRLIRLAQDSLPSLRTYARYSPEVPCMLAGLNAFQPLVEQAYGGGQPGLHITLEVTEDQDSYEPGEEPEYKDDRGPNCFGLPNPPRPARDINFQDGFKDDRGPNDTQGDDPGVAARATADPAMALSDPRVQRQVLNAVVAPVLGVPLDEVPDLAELLFGPMARDTAVGLA